MSMLFGEKKFTGSQWDRLENPLFAEWERSHVNVFEMSEGTWHKASDEFRVRTACIEKYGFAIPTEEALREILAVSPNGVVEIGAGSGYWSSLLKKLGVDVISCDDGSGMYTFKVGAYADVQKIDYRKFLKTEPSCKARTLLTVWPSYDNKEIFDTYKGNTVAYVGEIGDGCTQYDPAIEKRWEMVKEVEIPTWSGIHDSLGIFKRK